VTAADDVKGLAPWAAPPPATLPAARFQGNWHARDDWADDEPEEPPLTDRRGRVTGWLHGALVGLGLHEDESRPPLWRLLAPVAAAVVLLAAVTAGALALARSMSAQSAAPEPTPSLAPGPEPGEEGATEWSVGRTFESEDYTLVVGSITGQMKSLNDEGTWTTENGQFVVIELTVAYTGEEEGAFFPQEQLLLTDSGKVYPDDVQSSYAYKQHTLGTRPLLPARPQTGYLVFDIPADETPTALEFTGSLAADPIEVPFG
jgi:hypothetical protein